MLNRTFDQQRYSPLKEINTSNVGQLRMVWSRGLPAGTQESVPIVYRGVMYLFAPGATIQAVDATNGDRRIRRTADFAAYCAGSSVSDTGSSPVVCD